ncbi:hypothetical protein EAE96_008736 [Botrytis aclada]|nr:hypothetical protein EAE96_008736 [Botrytis aclada]
MTSRDDRSGYETASERSRRPHRKVYADGEYKHGPDESSEKASRKYATRGDGEKERDEDREKRRRTKGQERTERKRDGKEGDGKEGDGKEGDGKEGDGKEGDGKEGDRKEGDGKEGDRKEGDKRHRHRDRSHGRSRTAKSPTRSSAPSNNGAHSYASSNADPGLNWIKDNLPIRDNMTTVSGDETVLADPANGGRRMESDVGSKRRVRTSHSRPSEAPRSSSRDSDKTVTPRTYRPQVSTGSETKTHKSDDRKEKGPKIKSKHRARPEDTESHVTPDDSASNANYHAPPSNITSSSARKSLPPPSEVSAGSSSVNHRSDNGKGREPKVKSNHGARSRASEGSVAPSRISNTSSYTPSSSTASNSTRTPSSFGSEKSIGSNDTELANRRAKSDVRSEYSASTRVSSNYGSEVSRATEEQGYMIPVQLSQSRTSKDSNPSQSEPEEAASQGTPRYVSYSKPLKLQEHPYFKNA